jgi:hypothetical protein
MNGTKTMTCSAEQQKMENIHNSKITNGTVEADGWDKPAIGKYIKWDAKGVEVVPENEQEKIQAVSDQFNRFQMMNFNEHMHCLRGTHLKTQGVSSNITIVGNPADEQ